MDDALSKSQEMVTAMRILHGKHAEATRNHDEEKAAHNRTRESLSRFQEGHDKAQEGERSERIAHNDTRGQLATAQAALQGAEARAAIAEGALEAARAGIEAEKKRGETQRAAYASESKSHEEKHQAIASRLNQRVAELEQGSEQHVATSSQLDSAVRAQEAYRKEYHATVEALREAKEETGRHSEDLARMRAERVALDAQLKESGARLEEARSSLGDRDARLSKSMIDLAEHQRKAALYDQSALCIQEELDKVQDVVKMNTQRQ